MPQQARFDMDGFVEAMESLNAERILAFFTEDVALRQEALEMPLKGKDTLRSLLDAALPVVEAVELVPKKVVQEGPELAALLHAKARYKGDYDVAGQTLDLGGKRVEVDTALFATLDEQGRIREAQRIRDTWLVMRQLGISEEKMERVLEGMRTAT